MKQLFLEDLSKMTEEDIREHLISEYEVSKEELDQYNILIGYESVGSWGCDSSSFFLLQEKSTGKYFGVYGSHCSCFGFEGQFTPEEHTLEYLQSNHFSFYCGGYDGNEESNIQAVSNYIKELY